VRTYLALGLGLVAAAVLSIALSYPTAFAASGDANATAASKPADANMALALKAVAMLDKCSACHSHGWYEKPGMQGKKTLWGQDVPRLIKEKLVTPGKPDTSKLYTMIKPGMHPGNAAARPTADDIKAFGQWITDGCLDPVVHAASQPASAPAGH
jgi:hypothetical protein